MNEFKDADEESIRENLINLVKEGKSCKANDLKKLEDYLTNIKSYMERIEESGEYTEVLIDLEDDLAEILNDANFRQDSIGQNATMCEELLRIIYNYIAIDNLNTQVLLACNPFIPMDILKELMVSEEYWEEDGTQQALARNRKEPWILEKLSQSDQEMTRYEVAFNSSTPAEILEYLVEDTGQCDWRVEEIKFGEVTKFQGFIRWAVIQNQNTPKATLQKVIDGNVPALDPDVDVALKKLAEHCLKGQ